MEPEGVRNGLEPLPAADPPERETATPEGVAVRLVGMERAYEQTMTPSRVEAAPAPTWTSH